MTPKEILEKMTSPTAIFEIEWPGGSGLTNEQLIKLFEYERAGLIKRISAPNKWIYDIFAVPADAIWLLELADRQERELGKTLN